ERASRRQAGAHARQALEEKARIYDMLSGLDQDGPGAPPRVRLDEAQLAKILDESTVDFARMRRERAAAAARADSESGSASDGSMVEIVDEFGRSRVVPRSKARAYRGSDSDSDSSSASDSSDSDGVRGGQPPARRNHGAGFYHLSSDYAEREEQLAALRRLHTATEEERLAASATTAELQAQQLAGRRDQLRAALGRIASNTPIT
ncbi:hypothetical protein IWQ56_005983, partial [Coemansia nantahalensis]